MNRSGTIGLIGGTGPEGRGIVLRLAAAGLNVAVGSRVADRARDLANKLNDQLQAERVQGTDNATLISQSEILFLTVPFVHTDVILRRHGYRSWKFHDSVLEGGVSWLMAPMTPSSSVVAIKAL